MSRIIVIVIFWLAAPLLAQQSADEEGRIRFRALDLFVDSGSTPLAAYQFECFATNGIVRITGIEGGEHPAFNQAPYYDSKAMQHDRAIIAAFNTSSPDHLPTGKTRVATVHVAISGPAEPGFTVRRLITAKSDGTTIPAIATIQIRPPK
jgi:hypothetical protein